MSSRATLTPGQYEVLLKPISRQRVGQKQGQSHVEAYDIRAHLIRMFGFGNWDFEMLHTELLFDAERQLKNGKPGCYVAYRVAVRITIRNEFGHEVGHYDGQAVGAASQPDYMRADAHDMAVKTAESQALKRAAINLGDQFGLSLYNGGSTNALVRKVVPGSMSSGDAQADDDLPAIAPEQHDVVVVEEEPEPEPVIEDQVDRIVAEMEAEVLEGHDFVSDAQIRKMQAAFGAAGIRERDAKLRYIIDTIGRTIGSSKEMSKAEAGLVIDKLEGK